MHYFSGDVGADKHSDKRQREAIHAFAKSAGFTIVGEFYDAAVSGGDEVRVCGEKTQRPVAG